MFNDQKSEVGCRRSEVGQTLVESLLAIAVAVLVVTALVGVGISSMRTANFGKNQAEAVRLASQQLEVLQSMRDAGWLAFESSVTSCTIGSPCCVVYAGSYSVGTTCPATGDITATFWSTGSVANVSVDVTSRASFSEGSTNRTVTLNRTFSNWR